MPTNENNEPTLDIYFEEIEDAILLVRLEGKIIDQTTSQNLSEEIVSKLNPDRKLLIMDMSAIEYINSNGLNSLISVLTKTRTKGGEMVLFGINEKVNKLLVITKLSSVFTITTNLEEAKIQFNQINQN